MSRKRRQISVKAQGGLNSDINITPMVDVVLVLLIIFMVVTPLLEKDIEVKVPESEKVEEQDDLPQDQLVVTIAESGEVKINLDVMPTQEAYVEKLTKMLNTKKKGEKLVFFTADDKTNYAKLVAALDGARQAGAETLGMATDKIEAPGEAPPAPTP